MTRVDMMLQDKIKAPPKGSVHEVGIAQSGQNLGINPGFEGIVATNGDVNPRGSGIPLGDARPSGLEFTL